MNPLSGTPLIQWASLLPIWLVFLGGIVAAVVYWDHCPRAALLTVLAVVFLGVVFGVQPLVTHWLVKARASQDWTAQQLGFRMPGAGAVFDLLRALGYGLLLTAVFVGRRSTLRPPAAGTVYPPAFPDTRNL